MLTSAEVCERLRIGEKTLRRMIAEGDITAIKVGFGRWGGTWRISEEALAEYMERQTVAVEPDKEPGMIRTPAEALAACEAAAAKHPPLDEQQVTAAAITLAPHRPPATAPAAA